MQLAVVLFALASLQQQAAAAAAETATHKMQQAGGWLGEVTPISWSPRAFHLKGFLSDAECEHLKSISKDKLTASVIVDKKTGKTYESRSRTSKGTFLDMGQDEVVAAIEERVALATLIPKEHQEGLQVLKYVDGQKYEPHFDFFEDGVNTDPAHGGQRVVTMLMYLSTPEEGGETVFPDAEGPKMQGEGWSLCARQGLAHKPTKGDALLFYSLTPDGREDKHSLHGSCPTTKGEKWSATKWIHVHPYRQSAAWQKARWGGCADKNDRCHEWAAAGECDKNAAWMHDNCALSCKKCPCKDNHSRCAEWAGAGECEKNATWMHEHCALSCKKCDQKAATATAVA